MATADSEVTLEKRFQVNRALRQEDGDLAIARLARERHSPLVPGQKAWRDIARTSDDNQLRRDSGVGSRHTLLDWKRSDDSRVVNVVLSAHSCGQRSQPDLAGPEPTASGINVLRL